MIDFFRENIVCDIFLVLGVASWIITILAYRASMKEGRYISGLPILGGILVAIGFLTSSVKWLVFLGLLDPYIMYCAGSWIKGIIKGKNNKEGNDEIQE